MRLCEQYAFPCSLHQVSLHCCHQAYVWMSFSSVCSWHGFPPSVTLKLICRQCCDVAVSGQTEVALPCVLCLYMLQILNVNKGGITTVSNWVGVFVVLLALIMSEGAVDSLQNGLAASISGHFLKNSPLSYTR